MGNSPSKADPIFSDPWSSDTLFMRITSAMECGSKIRLKINVIPIGVDPIMSPAKVKYTSKYTIPMTINIFEAMVAEKIKNAYPKLLIATECINGFPSETKEDFKETIKVVIEISFDWGFVFPFSCRPGSLAEKIEPKVSNNEILDRMEFAGEYFTSAVAAGE